MQNFNISNFLQTLEQNQPKNVSKFNSDTKIEKVYLSFPDWQGKYQILPMIDAESGQPFVFLQKVREIKLPWALEQQDGTMKEFTSWVKILPAEAYTMLSADGQVVSSLTAADEELLRQAQSTFDMLYDELGGNSKDRNPETNKTISYMRRRNYSLFYGYCMNHWATQDHRTPRHQNFSALFICSAKGFSETIRDSISDACIQFGDLENWGHQIYNRNLTGRNGFLLFSVSLGTGGQIGYSLSAQHVIGNNSVATVTIPEDEAELMKKPIEGFLGWQADKREPGRLFNRKVMEETIQKMAAQIATIRATKGQNPVMAQQNTTGVAMGGQGMGQQTLDPMLQRGGNQMTNPGMIMGGNTNPYQTPPAAQIDPITQQPIQPKSPYSSPSFAQNLPF